MQKGALHKTCAAAVSASNVCKCENAEHKACKCKTPSVQMEKGVLHEIFAAATVWEDAVSFNVVSKASKPTKLVTTLRLKTNPRKYLQYMQPLSRAYWRRCKTCAEAAELVSNPS